MGSEGDDAGPPFPDNTATPGLGEDPDSCLEGMANNEDKDSNEEDKADWEEGGSEGPEEPSEDLTWSCSFLCCS